MIKVVFLLTIAVVLARGDQASEATAHSWGLGVRRWGVRAEKVTVEDAGSAGTAEEDEGVGVREEPELDGGGEGLEGLGVVILDESLDFMVSK